MSAKAWLAAGLCALPLAGCGMKGDLSAAPPLFGDARDQYEAERAAAAKDTTTLPDGRQRMEIPVTPGAAPATPPAAEAPTTAPEAEPKPE